MTGKSAPTVFVAFLGQHNLVDEPAAQGIGGRQPWEFDAAKPPLQCLEQRHEIPHGEDMVFHEQSQRVQPVDFLVKGMAQKGGPERREAVNDFLESIHDGPSLSRGV